MRKPRPLKMVEEVVRRSNDARSRRGVVHRVDGVRADIMVYDTKSIVRNVKVIGNADSLAIGQEVTLEWWDNGRPVVVAPSGVDAGVGGQVSISYEISTDDHGALTGLDDYDHTWAVHKTSAGTISAAHTFAPASPAAPFILSSNAQGQLVTGLRADQLNKQVIAGDGLTTGGTLTTNVTVNMGTPSTLHATTSNATTSTSHTHAITTGAPTTNLSVSSTNTTGSGDNMARAAHTHAINSSSNPGASASLLASDSNGYLQLERLGINVAPSYLLHIQNGAANQARIAYDASNYLNISVDSGGGTTLSTATDAASGNILIVPAGDIIIDPDGMDVLPESGYEINLGSLQKKYLTLHCAELWVETLVAQETVATIGGRILVGPTSPIADDLGASDTEVSLEYNQFRRNDITYMEANMSVEFFRVGALAITGVNTTSETFTIAGDWTSEFTNGVKFTVDESTGNDGEWTVSSSTYTTETVITVQEDITDATVDGYILYRGAQGTGPYVYQIDARNLDGSGANDWYAGDAMFNTGQAGDGFIDLYSYSGVTSGTTGPAIVGNVRQSATYNDWNECWALGNLDGLYGYGSTTYGVGLGEYDTDTSYITIDNTSGLRLFNSGNQTGRWYVNGDILIGRAAVGVPNIWIDASAGSTEWRIDTTSYVTLDVTYGFRIYDNSSNVIGRWYVNGDFRLGYYASGYANVFYDFSAKQLQFRGYSTVQAYVDTDGSIMAGGGSVKINASGITLEAGELLSNSINWYSTSMAHSVANIKGFATSSNPRINISTSPKDNTHYSSIYMLAGGYAGESSAGIYARSGYSSNIAYIDLNANKVMVNGSYICTSYNCGLYIGSETDAGDGNIAASNRISAFGAGDGANAFTAVTSSSNVQSIMDAEGGNYVAGFVARNNLNDYFALYSFGSTYAAGSYFGQSRLGKAVLLSNGADLLMGVYSNHALYIGTNNTLALTIDTGQAATFTTRVSVISAISSAYHISCYNSGGSAICGMKGGGTTGYGIYYVRNGSDYYSYFIQRGTGDTTVHLGHTLGGSCELWSVDEELVIGTQAAKALIMGTNNTRYFQITSGGAIGMGGTLDYTDIACVGILDTSTATGTYIYNLVNGNALVIQVATYTAGHYGPGICWQTVSNNEGRCKAIVFTYWDSNGSSIILGASSAYATGCNIQVLLGNDGSVGELFGPTTHKTHYLGKSGVAWDEAYADNWNNVADFYWLDEARDKDGKIIEVNDLSIICGIKPSENYDEKTGLRIIDDDTLPDWMFAREGEGDERQIAKDPDGKPWVSTRMSTSLSWGAIRQLAKKVEDLEARLSKYEEV